MADLEALAESMAVGATPSRGSGGRKPPPGRKTPETEPEKEKSESVPPPEVSSVETPAGKADEGTATSPEDKESGDSNDVERRPLGSGHDVARKEYSTDVTLHAAAQGAAELGVKAEMGDLFQVRVQPPKMGRWINEAIDTAAYALDIRRGDVAGAAFLILRNHFEEFAELLVAYGGAPTDRVKSLVWNALLKEEENRRPRVVDSE
jgi:hypothetical protein